MQHLGQNLEMDRIRYKYRFKTKDEFISEYGREWRTIVRCSWVTEMDWALGIEIENITYTILRSNNEEINKNLYDVIDDVFESSNDDYFFHFSGHGGGFNASVDMITRKEIKPNYKPKKFIRN